MSPGPRQPGGKGPAGPHGGPRGWPAKNSGRQRETRLPKIAEQPHSPIPKPGLASYRPDLARALTERGETAFRYRQVYEHLMRHPGVPFATATSLPGDLRSALEPLGASTLRLGIRTDDPDGTSKLLLRATSDTSPLETVIMRYRKRVTICVSTQVGCVLGCTFCATGSLGFGRDLTAAEIVDQVRHAAVLLADEGRTVSNVVYMGMGEPLLNFDQVALSLRVLHDPKGWGMAARSLSVSTVGIPSGIRRLAREEPQVNLALSLHAADDALRSELIPANRRYPLAEVMRACEDHFALTRRKLFVEYLLLNEVNDAPRQATALADLMRGRVVAVNLIPWNAGWGEYEPSPPERVRAFLSVLESRNVEVSLRESKGAAIAAACGQLIAGLPPRRTPSGAPRSTEAQPGPARGGRRPSGSKPGPKAGRRPASKPGQKPRPGGHTDKPRATRGEPSTAKTPAKKKNYRPPPTRDGR